jgi:pimeloyl-ACP methyl ester carboxylesterase
VEVTLVKRALVAFAVATLAIAGAAAALALSAWPAGFALRYGLWRLTGHGHERDYVTSDALQQHYLDAGQGPPLLLLHGGGGNRDAFFAQLPFLARHFHVLALDTRGHGRSEHGDDALSYNRYADDVLELLDQRRIDRATLVGWSDGGNTGLVLALAHPERVCRMVVISANFNPTGLIEDPPAPPPQAHEWASDLVEWLHGLLPQREDQHYPSEDELQQLWETGPTLTALDLHRIRAPVLVIGGEYDLIARDHLMETQRAIPDARLRIIPGVGHGVPQRAPVALNRVLGRFLLQDDGTPRGCSPDGGGSAAALPPGV